MTKSSTRLKAGNQRVPRHLSCDERASTIRVPRIPRARARTVRQFDSRYWQKVRPGRGYPDGVRPGAHRRRLARGAHSHRVRRRRTRHHGSVGDPRRDQSLRRRIPARATRRCTSWGRCCGTDRRSRSRRYLPQDRVGRVAAAVVRGDRAHHRHRHHEDQDLRRAHGRPVRRERPEGVDFARAAFRPDAAARAHDAARQRSRRRPTGSRCFSWISAAPSSAA